MYDFRNRHYLPVLGRFIQPDPKQFKAGEWSVLGSRDMDCIGRMVMRPRERERTSHYNLYRYCHNDPVNKTDPTGLIPDEGPGSAFAEGASAQDAQVRASQAILGNVYKAVDDIVYAAGQNIQNDSVGTVFDVASAGKFSQLKGQLGTVNRGQLNTAKEAAKALFRSLAAGLKKEIIRDRESRKIVGVGTGKRGPTYRPKLDGSYSVGKEGEVQHFRPPPPPEPPQPPK